MKRIAIVDDDEQMRLLLKSYIDKFSESYSEKLQVSLFAFPELFLTNYRPEYDMVLMDIDMPSMNGLQASKRLRKLDENVVLVFVTNLAQYAIKGYEVDATDFIVKPVSYEKFAVKLTRALKHVPEGGSQTLLLKTEDGTVTVDISDVKYIEVQGHYVFYHTHKDVYRIRGSLKQTIEKVNNQQFFVCDKCFIVNLAYIEAVLTNTVSVDGEEINVSRPKKKALMDALSAYHNRK